MVLTEELRTSTSILSSEDDTKHVDLFTASLQLCIDRERCERRHDTRCRSLRIVCYQYATAIRRLVKSKILRFVGNSFSNTNIMVYSHCKWPGKGMGLGEMSSNILCRSVLKQGQGSGALFLSVQPLFPVVVPVLVPCNVIKPSLLF